MWNYCVELEFYAEFEMNELSEKIYENITYYNVKNSTSK